MSKLNCKFISKSIYKVYTVDYTKIKIENNDECFDRLKNRSMHRER